MPRRTLHRSLARLASGATALVVVACSNASPVQTQEASQVGPQVTSGPPTTATDTAPSGTGDVPATTERGASGSTEGPSSDRTDAPADGIEWEQVDDLLDVGRLDVPIDYDEPDGDSFTLFLVRHRAADQDRRIGSLLINPGGPGAGGAQFAAGAEFIFDDKLLDRFDIIGWDPRGTANTTPAIDCIDDYDEYFAGIDVTPDDEAERQRVIDVAEDFEDQCVARNTDILQHVGTNDSAHDIDSIRRALGEDQISYFGFSYGSELGATWATLFPDTVRAAVLDGAADPTADAVEHSIQQSKGFEDAVATYLADCSADAECAFHSGGDSEAAFDELMTSLDEDPIPSEPGRPDVDLGVARVAVVRAMYDDSLWDQLSNALADAQDGDGKGLLDLYDTYYQRNPDGTWPNFLEAFQVISCMDNVERPTVEESDAEAVAVHEVAPRVAPSTTGDYSCTFMPPTESPRVAITGAGAGPIVVVGTTGDPATPLAGTRVMADTLEDGRLVVVTADKHTGYGETACGDDVIHSYLVDLEVPPEETDC